jgi:hypothetical protein
MYIALYDNHRNGKTEVYGISKNPHKLLNRFINNELLNDITINEDNYWEILTATEGFSIEEYEVE